MKKVFLMTMMMTLFCVGTIQAQKDSKYEVQASEARLTDVNSKAYIKPAVAELVVDGTQKRVKDVWNLSASDLASRIVKNNDEATMQNLRSYAVYKSSEKYECDLIIAANFDIKLSDTGCQITITGYPANFKNWRVANNEDIVWINSISGSNYPVPGVIVDNLKKK